MKLRFDFCTFYFCNFKAVPETQEDVPHSKNKSYQPQVSDISDSELVESAISVEKALKVRAENTPTVFRLITVRNGCHRKIAFYGPGKLEMNPPRSENDMTELNKRRWVHFKFFLGS